MKNGRMSWKAVGLPALVGGALGVAPALQASPIEHAVRAAQSALRDAQTIVISLEPRVRAEAANLVALEAKLAQTKDPTRVAAELRALIARLEQLASAVDDVRAQVASIRPLVEIIQKAAASFRNPKLSAAVKELVQQLNDLEARIGKLNTAVASLQKRALELADRIQSSKG